MISTVRTNPGTFVSEYNRINVALTRAKHGLVIVGNARTLRKDPMWSALLTIHENNVVRGLDGARWWV
jgi:superfamily I DNA and/or RNA helicase